MDTRTNTSIRDPFGSRLGDIFLRRHNIIEKRYRRLGKLVTALSALFWLVCIGFVAWYSTYRLNHPMMVEHMFVIAAGFAVITFVFVCVQKSLCDRLSRREQFAHNVLQKTGRELVELVRDPPSQKAVLATEARELLNTRVEITDARGRTHHISVPLNKREKQKVMRRLGL